MKRNCMRNKKLQYWQILLCFFVFSACGEDGDIVSKNKQQNDSAETTLELNLTAQMSDDDVRAMSFDVASDGPKLNMTDETVTSVAVIANKAKTKVYYANILWQKTQGKNHLYCSGEVKDFNNQNINLTLDEEWFIMGYVGGTFNKDNKRVSFDPNGNTLQATSVGGKVNKSVPVYFPWTRLRVENGGSNAKAMVGTLDKGTIRFRTLGIMMRVELSNTNTYPVRFKSITYQSHSLTTTAGYYDLSTTTLPAIPANPDGTVAESVAWVPSGTEPKYTFVDAGGVSQNVTVDANGTSDKYFLVWGMPRNSTDKRTSKRNITHILAHAVRLNNGVEQNIPKMETVYVWGSTIKPGTKTRRVIQKAKLLRIKQTLEYFSDGYVGTNPRAANPIRKTTVFDTGIGRFRHNQISQADFMGAAWRVPTEVEARGLFYHVTTYLRFVLNGQNGPHHQNDDVKINGETLNLRDTYYNGASATIYGLRSSGAGSKYYSAWRYVYAATRGVRIEAVYLGPNYKGDALDIMEPSFWTLHKPDYVSRYYPAVAVNDVGGGTRYHIPTTWIKGRFFQFTRALWTFGTPERTGLHGPYMSGMAVINPDRSTATNYVYHEVIAPVIALERDNTPWPNNN